MTVTLGTLKVGDSGKVQALLETDRVYRRKLLAMGLTPGALFTIIRVAPLGDPIQLQIRGFSLSLRRDEAQAVEVTVL